MLWERAGKPALLTDGLRGEPQRAGAWESGSGLLQSKERSSDLGGLLVPEGVEFVPGEVAEVVDDEVGVLLGQ